VTRLHALYRLTYDFLFNGRLPRACPHSSTSYCRGRFGGGGGGGDDGLGIGCSLLNVAGLPTEDNLPIGNRVEGGGVGKG